MYVWGVYLFMSYYPSQTLLCFHSPKLNCPISLSRIILDCSRMVLSFIKVICDFLKNLGLKSLPMFPLEQWTVPHPRELASGKYYKMLSVQNLWGLCMRVEDGVQN